MTEKAERIDHVNDAMACLIAADGYLSADMPHETGEYKSDVIAVAQVHATLALVEQQRIANLIALGNAEHGPYRYLDAGWTDLTSMDALGSAAVLLGIELKEESK